jgi:M6 family metalloprotease-like protein
MKPLFFILLLWLWLWLCGVSFAAPASGGNLLITQSGNTIDVKLFGDEFFNWYQSSDNYILGINSSGNFEYMGNVSDNLTFTGEELSSTADLSMVIQNDFPSSNFFKNTKAERNSKLISGNALSTIGTINNLVVLVYFNDHTDSDNTLFPDSNFVITPEDTTSYENIFNAGSQSLKDYYQEMSRNNLTIQSYLTPWLKVSGNEQDYGTDVSGNIDMGIEQLYDDVIEALNSGNVDALPILDGSVQYDMMTIIHSGRNQASLTASSNTSRLWSKWDYLTSPDNITVGGSNIQISRIVTTSALGGEGDVVTDLGVLCHETAHHFGLPDLYEYREAHFGIGTWGLMGLGSWGFSGNIEDAQNPMPLSAYSLDKLEWVTTTLRDVSSANVNLSEMEGGSEVLKFRGNGVNEFYLMEYRDFDASYYGNDMSQIAAPGALLYHVYQSAFSSNSNDISHPIVRVIEADDNGSLSSGNALVESGDVWNASSDLSEFSIDFGSNVSHSGLYNTDYALPDISTPSYNRIENVRVENGDILFDYTGQRSSISIQDFNNGIIQWEPVEGAATYRLEREDDNSGIFNTILSGNNVTSFDDPDISGTVNFKYKVIASRYVGQSELYSDEFFYGFSVSQVSFDADAANLTMQFNAEVNLASKNVFLLSGMRILDDNGNLMFSLAGSSSNVYSFPGITNTDYDAQFETSTATTDSIEIALSTAQLYEMIEQLKISDLLFEIDANSAEMKLTPFLNNSAQLHSDGQSISVSETADSTSPVLETATYDDSRGQFTLGYSEPIWFTSLDLSNFVFSESSETTSLDGSSYSISENVLSITLDNEKKARATLLNYISGNVTSLAINTSEITNLSGLGSNHSAASLTIIEDTSAPYLESFIMNNRDENQTLELFFNEGIFFPQGVPSGSADFEVVIVDAAGNELVSVSGNGYTATAINDTLISPNISRVDSVLIELLPSEIEAIDEAYGFVNPAPTAYVKIQGEVFSDYRRFLDNLSHQVNISKKVSSDNYTPKRRARFVHPHYDDDFIQSDEDEGLIWKSSHLVRWEINGGWDLNDSIRLEWAQGGNVGVVAENFTLDVSNSILVTTQSKLWDTTTVSDNAGYQFSLLRESDSKLYQASQNTVEVDNTQPKVFFSYISNSNPTSFVNAEVPVNPNLHTFPLTSQEERDANIIIVANYNELMIASPTLTIDKGGAVDPVVTMSPAEGTLPSNVFYYAYDVIEQDGVNHIDGFAQISITDERDRARGHLLVDSDVESEDILGNISEEVDSSTVFFSIDTIPPTISSLEFSITFESIVAETSELKLKFSESLYREVGDELITGVLDPDNYFLSGSSATNGLEVNGVSVDVTNGEYTLSLNGIVDLGNLELSIFKNNITDFNNNSFGTPSSATAVWPGPLINLHEVVLSKGGRTRLVLRGGFTPYEHFIAPVYQSIVTLDPIDNKTIYGVGDTAEEFFVDVTENRGQLRVVRGELSDARVNSVISNLNTYRDELDFQMVTFPFNLSTWDGEGLFDLLQESFGSHGADYVLYHYDDTENYVPVIDDTTEVGPGYGFFMASRKENKSTIKAKGPLLEQVVAVDLHKGWNLIGNPFDVDISIDQIYVSTDATRYTISDVTQSETGHKLWYIDINLPQYQSLSTLAPFMGAWLYVENSAGAEVMFFRTPEDPDLEIYFPPEKPSLEKAAPPSSEAFPPIRPLSYSSPNGSFSSSESGGGGGGGCLLKFDGEN